jgi:hypothetical protein
MSDEEYHRRTNAADAEIDRLLLCIKVIAEVVQVVAKIVDHELADQPARS